MRKVLLSLALPLALASCGLFNPPANPGTTPPGSTNPGTVSVTLAGPTSITGAGPQIWTANTSGPVSSVDFYLDGYKLGTDTQTPFQVSQTLSSADNGSHTLKAVAIGTSGQQASNQLTFTVNVASAPEPQPQPQPTAPFIPAAGAAVGTGDGTKLGTVYVSPKTQEVEFMTLLSEVRTKGTVNGVDLRAGTCLAGVQPGTLKPLTFNGVSAYASRKHAEYLGSWGDEGHEENNPNHPAFYARTAAERITRAGNELGAPGTVYGGEIITVGGNGRMTATQAVSAFLNSPDHCALLANPAQISVGVGYVQSQWVNGPTLITYPNNWVAAFGR